MKKFILFLMALIAVVASVSAQVTSPAVELDRDGWYYYFGGSATVDTASTGGAWSKIIMPNKPQILFYDMRVKITEVTATTSTAIALKAKKMDTDAWTTVTTITYKGTGSDTTVVFSEASTATHWRFYQWVVTPANGKVKVSWGKYAIKF